MVSENILTGNEKGGDTLPRKPARPLSRSWDLGHATVQQECPNIVTRL